MILPFKIENIPNPLIIYDKDWNISQLNYAAVQMLAYNETGDLLGKSIYEILHQGDYPEIGIVVDFAQSGQVYHAQKELYHLNKAGRRVGVLASFSAMDGGHTIESCFPTQGNYATLNKQIDKLRNFKTIAENVPGLDMILVNKELKILSSVGFEIQKQGWAEPEADGQYLYDYFLPKVVNILKPLLTIAFGATPVSREFKMDNNFYSIRLIPLIDDQAEIICVIVFQNITETKLIEEKLRLSKKEAENANKAKGSFIAKMSHEIRTPLNAIMGFSQQLKKTRLSQKQSHFVEVIHNSSNHLLSIIDKILVISKIDAEEMELEQEPFRLQTVIDAAHDVVEIKYRQKKLSFDIEIDPQLQSSIVLGDPAKLRQVLINLLNNAIKFTRVGGIKLRLSINRQTAKSVAVLFEVEDTGIGISSKDLKMIFQPFRQIDERVGRSYAGTGLGLTISREIIEKQNGIIWVKSKKGEGSIFSFVLELKKTKQLPADEERKNRNRKFDTSHARLLFVDDDTVNRMLGQIILKDMKIKADFAASGQEAMKLFAPGKYDLILLDINMPDFDGMEVSRHIRQKEKKCTKSQPVRIVAMTANAFKNHIRNYFKAGMDDIILKPFTEEILQDKILRNLMYNTHQSSGKTKAKHMPVQVEQTDFSLNQLVRITKGDKGFMIKMLDTFIENTAMLTKRMNKALQRDDYNDIAEAAHRLLPSVQQLGMSKAANLLAKIDSLYLRKSNYQPDEALIDAAIAELKIANETIMQAKLELVNQNKE